MSRTQFLPFLCLALGCSTKTLSDYKTNQVMATISATGTSASNTHVAAELNDKSNSLIYLQLTADDAFTATHGTTTQAMKETSLLGFVDYETDFNSADSTAITVTLTRKVDNGAPNTVITLPQAFNLAPLPSANLSRAQNLSVGWDTVTSDPMSVTVTGACIQTWTGSPSANAGDLTIPSNALHLQGSGSDAGTQTSCAATLEVTRQKSAALDPSFGGGSAQGAQTRQLSFTTVP